MIVDDSNKNENQKEPLLEVEKDKDLNPQKNKKIGFDYDVYRNSNCLSKLFFYWAFKILRLARITPLKVDYLGTLEGENDSKNFNKNLLYFWDNKNYKSISKNGLFKTLLRANIFRIIVLFIFSVIISFLEFLCVLIIKEYIDYFQTPDQRRFSLLTLGIAFISSRTLSTFLYRQLNILEIFLASKSSLELTCFIYNKVLKASPSSFGEKSSQGEIVNFIQVDAPRLSYAITLSPSLLICPVSIGVYIYLLFKFFGISFLSGMFLLIIFIFISYNRHKMYQILDKEMLEKKDKRMKVTTETFDTIKLLKLYNWENEFMDRILQARDEELVVFKKELNLSVFGIVAYWSAPMIASIVTIGLYQYLNSTIMIGNILIGLTIFNNLQPLISELPNSINNILETIVSIGRIEKFIKQDDIDPSMLQEDKIPENLAIKIQNADFTWGADPTNPDKEKKENSKENPKEPHASNEDEKVEKEKERSTIERVSVCNLDTVDNINSNSEILTIEENASGNKNIQEEEQKIIPTIINQEIKEIKESKSINELTLKNINLEINKGETVGIIGEVSSGKSSLLQAILNNLIYVKSGNSNEGQICINGSTAYVSQVPWIQNDTIKNNILFFNEYDEKKYQKVVQICQLEPDLEMLEAGDNTEIGEKGINLSGGQKARVSLARSVYADRDIYLLDDPISALDAHVGKKIIEECILKYLQGRTILLVTHALQYLKYMTKIIYLSQGKIMWTGTYKELKEAEFFKELSQKLHRDDQPEQKSQDVVEEETETKKIAKQSEIKRITKDEEQEVGEVKLSVYLKYLEYMGGKFFAIMIVLIMFLWQINKAGSDFWLAFWSQKQNQDSHDKWIFFSIYSSLGLGSTICIFFRIFLLTRGTLKLAYKLHRDMIVRLIKAPINLFHDTKPRGQIYNRLSKDLNSIIYLMYYCGWYLSCFFSVIGAIVICSIYQPISLVFVPFFGIFGYLLSNYYLKGGRDLSRLDGISRSPLLNTISETISGSITIRAFKYQEGYLNKFYSKVNDLFKVEIFINGASNWFGMYMDFVSLTFITFIIVIIYIYEKEFTPQSVALLLTYQSTLKYNLFLFFKLSTDFENSMVAMERCLEFTRVEEEKEFDMPNDKELALKNWPKEGKIEFVDYSVKYRPNTEVILKNLNFTINPKEKIGVVGRTGSGKSTMCLSLFRILEPLCGTIRIDDVDITSVGLNLLRQELTIIPQDPSLMKGTLKYNIDPFNKYSDEEILKVLSMVGFDALQKNQSGLDKMISEAGENLSVGEKQLICIARAILRKSKIVIMDEATANIDIKTEETIQKAIHSFFSDTTIITIAHRIKTILNYDRILVLKNGEIEEFDTPNKLIENKNSLFFELYSKSSI